MKTFRELMGGHKSCEIRCAYTGYLARKLTVNGDMVHLDAITESIDVPLDTEITYKPWVMDRGELMFTLPHVPHPLKVCGEFDLITYEDGWEICAQAPAP